MTLVTLIGEKIAIEGQEFIYLGPNSECRNCKLKTVCFNLKIGRRYRITNIREKRHECNLHDGNAAVVEVVEQPIITTIDIKLTEGASSKINQKECKNIGCQYYEICNTTIQKDKKYKIQKIYKKIDCPIGYELQKAELIDE